MEDENLTSSDNVLASPIPLKDLHSLHYDEESHTLSCFTSYNQQVWVYQLAGQRLDCDHLIATIEIKHSERYLGTKYGQVFIQD